MFLEIFRLTILKQISSPAASGCVVPIGHNGRIYIRASVLLSDKAGETFRIVIDVWSIQQLMGDIVPTAPDEILRFILKIAKAQHVERILSVTSSDSGFLFWPMK